MGFSKNKPSFSALLTLLLLASSLLVNMAVAEDEVVPGAARSDVAVPDNPPQKTPRQLSNPYQGGSLLESGHQRYVDPHSGASYHRSGHGVSNPATGRFIPARR